MKRNIAVFAITFLIAGVFLIGCEGNNILKPKNPVTLNIWHNYGAQMKNTMDKMVDEFNDTIGAKKGIIINVTSISSSAALHEKLTMAANKDPGAPLPPDITTAYPKTAVLLAQKGLLVDLGEHFTEEELAAYVPRFVEEGRLLDNKLYVFPIAKSTEVVFVNKTVFERFAADTGISLEDLRTFEGIIKSSAKYYEWTDQQTPQIKQDGKTFFMPDSLFNLAQIGFRQFGDDFLKGNKPNFSSPVFSKVWKFFYEPAVRGQAAIFNGYASDLAKTGDVICAIGSTAGVLFYTPSVTYADNRTEAVEYTILPYPTFEGGKKIAMQRGGGMCILKSTKEKEEAAVVFLKWFTEPPQNLRFVSSTGYLPVTKEAFGDVMTKEIDNISDENIKKLLGTAIEMQQSYDFYIPPLFDDYDKLQKEYENKLKQIAAESKEEYQKLLRVMDANTAFERVAKEALEKFTR